MLSYYSPNSLVTYVYMLQAVEYDAGKFLKWLTHRPNLRYVMKRGKLVQTRKAQALIAAAALLFLLNYLVGFWLLINLELALAVAVVLFQPLITAVILAACVWASGLILNQVRRPLLGQARERLQQHKAIKVAVLGSYGKTTMKEILATVLGRAKTVKATPGNMNVPISHARWVTNEVEGSEDVLIFEYGEGQPGDIARMAELTVPDYAVVTGLAPNHLDKYPSLDAVAKDLAAISQFVKAAKLYVHDDGTGLVKELPGAVAYSLGQVGDWRISNIKVGYQGTKFTMSKKDVKLTLVSRLVGRHQVGVLAAAADLALQLGLTAKEVVAGIAQTRPFEHRMQARELHGAWIIDDTYNGNLEGIRAGLQLMQELPAKRKIYVTPGLVDQGQETEPVHREIGRLIAAAKPDKVVLMQNSVTDFIRGELQAAGYSGELSIETDPLHFYSNIEHTVAAGDLVVLQNDWTDNYY